MGYFNFPIAQNIRNQTFREYSYTSKLSGCVHIFEIYSQVPN